EGLAGEMRPEEDTPQLAAIDPKALLALVLDSDAYGKALSQALFADPAVRKLFLSARQRAAAAGQPLRVRLALGRGTERLHNLLWETLVDPQDETRVGDSGAGQFSRYLNNPTSEPRTQ